MIQNNIGAKAIRFVIKDVVLDMVLWPWWWYTTGVVEAFIRLVDTIKQANDELAIGIWLKNMLVPMYGDYSWQGRIISFFMRATMIIGKSLLFLGWAIVSAVIFLLWIIIPLFIGYHFLLNIGLLNFIYG